VSYFDKFSESLLRISSYCPRFSEYQETSPDSIRLQNTLYVFYAVIVAYCTKVIQAFELPALDLKSSLWKTLLKELSPFETEIKQRSQELREEVKLASQQMSTPLRLANMRNSTRNSIKFHSNDNKGSQVGVNEGTINNYWSGDPGQFV
jgi:hypothetical protein